MRPQPKCQVLLPNLPSPSPEVKRWLPRGKDYCVCVCRLMLHHYVIVNWVLTIQNPETKYFFEETKYFCR